MQKTKNLQSFSPLALAAFEINETEIKLRNNWDT